MKKKLGMKIKIQRNNRDLKLRQVAAECEISPASLSDIEKGVNFPAESTFIRLVNALHFEDKSEIYDLYADLKKTAPPDITEYLTNNKSFIPEVRRLISLHHEGKVDL